MKGNAPAAFRTIRRRRHDEETSSRDGSHFRAFASCDGAKPRHESESAAQFPEPGSTAAIAGSAAIARSERVEQSAAGAEHDQAFAAEQAAGPSDPTDAQ